MLVSIVQRYVQMLKALLQGPCEPGTPGHQRITEMVKLRVSL